MPQIRPLADILYSKYTFTYLPIYLVKLALVKLSCECEYGDYPLFCCGQWTPYTDTHLCTDELRKCIRLQPELRKLTIDYAIDR